MGSQLLCILNELATFCIEKAFIIATAESCTGGGVSYQITSLPGSSHWFDRGFVTYSNIAKVEMLGVNHADIHTFGAVSQEVAKQMAEGALKNSRASLTLSITGTAGPEGGSHEKPVGTCWFAWSSLIFGTHCKKMLFSGDRCNIRDQAILFALEHLLHLVKKYSNSQ
jgi:nicotinamide-nucleotide amidase